MRRSLIHLHVSLFVDTTHATNCHTGSCVWPARMVVVVVTCQRNSIAVWRDSSLLNLSTRLRTMNNEVPQKFSLLTERVPRDSKPLYSTRCGHDGEARSEIDTR